MTKLGVLYLNGGVYNRMRLVTKEWIEQSTYPHVAIEKKYMSWGYGYYWKTSKDLKIFRASGSFGQDTLVIPSLGLVVGVQCREGTRAIVKLHDAIQKYLENTAG